MTLENVELVHECYPKHLGMGTANEDKEMEKDGQRGRENMERNKAGTTDRNFEGPN